MEMDAASKKGGRRRKDLEACRRHGRCLKMRTSAYPLAAVDKDTGVALATKEGGFQAATIEQRNQPGRD
jgi:hypothetical protein